MLGLLNKFGQFITGDRDEESMFGNTAYLPLPGSVTGDYQTDEGDAHIDFHSSNDSQSYEYEEYLGTRSAYDDDDDEDDIEAGTVYTMKTPEESKQFVTDRYSTYIENHLGRPPEYDTDLLCNITLTDQNTWHVPASHIFVEILLAHSCAHEGDGNPILFEENAHEEFFIYQYEDIIDLVRDVCGWFAENGLELKRTQRFSAIAEYVLNEPDNLDNL